MRWFKPNIIINNNNKKSRNKQGRLCDVSDSQTMRSFVAIRNQMWCCRTHSICYCVWNFPCGYFWLKLNHSLDIFVTFHCSCYIFLLFCCDNFFFFFKVLTAHISADAPTGERKQKPFKLTEIGIFGCLIDGEEKGRCGLKILDQIGWHQAAGLEFSSPFF